MGTVMLKPSEAATILKIGRSKMYNLLASGKIPTIRVGSTFRIPADKLQQWIEAQLSK